MHNAPNLSAIAGEESTEAETLTPEPVITNAPIITDNRPAFSFGQMMNQNTPAFQPEYDPDQISPLQDPCFDDAPDRSGFDR